MSRISMNRAMTVFAALVLLVAIAAQTAPAKDTKAGVTTTMSLLAPATFAGNELKPGDYAVSADETHVTDLDERETGGRSTGAVERRNQQGEVLRVRESKQQNHRNPLRRQKQIRLHRRITITIADPADGGPAMRDCRPPFFAAHRAPSTAIDAALKRAAIFSFATLAAAVISVGLQMNSTTTTPAFDLPRTAQRARFAVFARAPCVPSQPCAFRARRRNSTNYFNY